MANNASLHKANVAKNDEFYTQLTDIEKELSHYKEHFQDKVVFCNCDDPEYSNFWKYFQLNFYHLGLKKLIATHYEREKPSYKMEIVHQEKGVQMGIPDYVKTPLKENGDFRSPECVEILKECDIVVTNPPFSLFREYLAQLIEYNKKFVIIAPLNSMTYKEVFPLLKGNQIWCGYGFQGGNAYFATTPKQEYAQGVYDESTGLVKFRNVIWFTNLDIPKRHEDLFLYKNYTPEEYPTYDNYDAINVDKTQDIPCDYDGVMGVPITFMDKYNPSQFEIVALGIVGSIEFSKDRKMEILKDGKPTGKYTINAKGTLYKKYNSIRDKKPPAFKDVETGELYSSIYARVIIRRKKNEN